MTFVSSVAMFSRVWTQKSNFRLFHLNKIAQCPASVVSYLTPFAKKPKVFAPVLSQNVHGALRRAQAAVRWGSIDALAVVLKLQISRTVKSGLVLLDHNHGVLQLRKKKKKIRKHLYSAIAQSITALQSPFRPTHISLINIGAGFCNAFQALANDGHHILLCFWK